MVGALSVNTAKDMALFRRILAVNARLAPLWNRELTTFGLP
jgi:hypothetical protein